MSDPFQPTTKADDPEPGELHDEGAGPDPEADDEQPADEQLGDEPAAPDPELPF
jgi:hypothetical protein